MYTGEVPNHIAIIMDGNGRWAQARGLPRAVGHRQGVEALRRTAEACLEMGIRHLTLFAFSTENWLRPEDEVSKLLALLRFHLRSEIAELHRRGVRLRIIGQKHRFGAAISRLLDHGEALTGENDKLVLTVALSYGARDEIATAARLIAEQAKAGQLDPATIDEHLFSRYLFTAGLPDPDFLIRTSGEKRISNFLLWQMAYAELIFTDRLWPDFSRVDLEDAIREFRGRDRRFGAIGVTTSR